jgi:hypothetical protein
VPKAAVSSVRLASFNKEPQLFNRKRRQPRVMKKISEKINCQFLFSKFDSIICCRKTLKRSLQRLTSDKKLVSPKANL